MTRWAGPILGLAAVACAPQSTAPDEAGDVDFTGTWQLAAIDGRELGPGSRIVLTVGDDLIRWEPGCAQLMSLYTIEGSAFRADPIRYAIPPDADPSEVMPPPCAIGLLPGHEEALKAMAAGRLIETLPDDGIRISGGGHSVQFAPHHDSD